MGPLRGETDNLMFDGFRVTATEFWCGCVSLFDFAGTVIIARRSLACFLGQHPLAAYKATRKLKPCLHPHPLLLHL